MKSHEFIETSFELTSTTKAPPIQLSRIDYIDEDSFIESPSNLDSSHISFVTVSSMTTKKSYQRNDTVNSYCLEDQLIRFQNTEIDTQKSLPYETLGFDNLMQKNQPEISLNSASLSTQIVELSEKVDTIMGILTRSQSRL